MIDCIALIDNRAEKLIITYREEQEQQQIVLIAKLVRRMFPFRHTVRAYVCEFLTTVRCHFAYGRVAFLSLQLLKEEREREREG